MRENNSLERVLVAKANERSDVETLIDSSISQMLSPQKLSGLKKIVIKPNLCALMSPESGATTSPHMVESLIRVLKTYAPGASINVVESDSFERDAEEAFTRLGYEDLAQRYDIKLIDLTRDDKIPITLQKAEFMKSFQLPMTFLDCDFFISVAKLKTHSWERYSGILKNQFGCIPQRSKTELHPFLSQVIPDINSIFRPDFCVLDGIVALEGKGPTWGGKPKRMNVLLFSNNPVAIDTIGSRIMGIDPESVPHLVSSSKRGIGSMKKIEIVGEDPRDISSTFESVDRYTYYSYRTGLLLQRIAKQIERSGDWMIGTKWKYSKPFSLLPRRLRRFLKAKA